ncbi:cellulose biosynthesis protein BcsD [Candidatus Pantoea floridensis]|uniref:Cellulose synthase subunit D n=1 Tax=Candidatus Pantoea floridensis TaxID=1938870 RepID=A0A286BT08_9GAMM|nr:cellulose biosynthesis protein BcsD [Pantoea floridensis]PIF23852.1 cellulose synthase subunit D [Enterobacteriaceae bacterium JKS000233]SOD37305.1 Cellulose synthase subunit D [Pantoea floridensis]
MSEQIAARASHPHQPGWFDLVSVMIESMLDNAGEEAEGFLQGVGASLATRYPLAEARTVQDLEREMNLQLARFNWGFVQLQPQQNAILLQHHALPQGDIHVAAERWQLALSAVLAGLYAQWLQAQGGSAAVPVTLEKNDGGTLHYRYQ